MKVYFNENGGVGMDLHLQKKNALILASSQGLGKAIAAELVKEGANVMLASRDEKTCGCAKRIITAWGRQSGLYGNGYNKT